MEPSNMPSSMSSQISSSDQKSKSQIMLLIGGIALVIILGGAFYWYQYAMEQKAAPQTENSQNTNQELLGLEQELNATDLNNLDAELTDIEQEIVQ